MSDPLDSLLTRDQRAAVRAPIERAHAASRGLHRVQQFYSPFWDVMHHAFSQQVLDALEV